MLSMVNTLVSDLNFQMVFSLNTLLHEDQTTQDYPILCSEINARLSIEYSEIPMLLR
jgi:hypothetical protein